MVKRIYSESIKKWAKGIGITGGSLIGLVIMYLIAVGSISDVTYSGDVVCAGTELDPCYAYINFTAEEDIFIYPTGYDPWGRNTLFNFNPGVKSWKLERSWGSGWREIDLSTNCKGTWCGAPNSDGDTTYSIAFREDRDYRIRVTAYKYNPSDTIKWGAFSGVDEIDPVWLPTQTDIINETFDYNATGIEKYLFSDVSYFSYTEDELRKYELNVDINLTVYNFLKDAYLNPTVAKCDKIKEYIVDDYPDATCGQIHTMIKTYANNNLKFYKDGIESGVLDLNDSTISMTRTDRFDGIYKFGENTLKINFPLNKFKIKKNKIEVDEVTYLKEKDDNDKIKLKQLIDGTDYEFYSGYVGNRYKTTILDYKNKKDGTYIKTYTSDQEIKKISDYTYILSRTYSGKNETSGKNMYEDFILDIADICEPKDGYNPECKYNLTKNTHLENYTYERDICVEVSEFVYDENENLIETNVATTDKDSINCVKTKAVNYTEELEVLDNYVLEIEFNAKYDSLNDYVYIDPYYYYNGTEILESDFQATFDTTRTTSGSSNASQITLPLVNHVSSSYSFMVDWGDGQSSYVDAWDSVNKTHTYSTSGEYNITISGEFVGWRFANTGDRNKLLDIKQWGNLRVGNANGYFYGASYMTSSATDMLNITGTTDMQSMFVGAFVYNENITGWNTSQVTNMRDLFRAARKFNQSIGVWDTSSLTGSLADMFNDAVDFDQDISNWDVSRVTSLFQTFYGATNFNQDISGWDVGKVESFWSTFRNAEDFNQPIGSWDTSSATIMQGTFMEAESFNQNLSNWNTSKVTVMSHLFRDAVDFEGIGLENWDVGKVTTMDSMFRNADSFNISLSSWDTSSVTNFLDMFFYNNGFNGEVENLVTGGSTVNIQRMFVGATSFNQDVSSWNFTTSSFSRTFDGATSFNQDLSSWDTSSVSSVAEMFRGASSFNQDLSAWDTSSITNYRNFLVDASSFNQDLGHLNISIADTNAPTIAGTNLSTENYDKTLLGWASQSPNIADGLDLNAETLTYSNCTFYNGEAAKIVLNTTYSWVITDGGLNTTYVCPTEPGVNFIDPTPIDGSTALGSEIINVSISENSFPIKEIIYDWNNTNYSLYEDLKLSMNMNNNSKIGENDTYFVDNKGLSYGICGNNSFCPDVVSNGKYGGALDFEYDNTDWIRIKGDNLGAMYDSTSFTVSLWFNQESTRSGATLLSDHMNYVDVNTRFILRRDYLYYQLVGGGLSNWDIPEGTINNGQWYNYVITYQSGGKGFSFYKDGIFMGNKSVTGTIDSKVNDLRINGYYNLDTTSSNLYDGLIDELNIWNRELSEEEVTLLYNSNLKKFNNTQWYLTINQTNITSDTYEYQVFVEDNFFAVNQTEIRTLNPGSSNTSCSYTSGNWEVDCSDNCIITTPYNLGGNNIVFSNAGMFYVEANIDEIGAYEISSGCSMVIGNGITLTTS